MRKPISILAIRTSDRIEAERSEKAVFTYSALTSPRVSLEQVTPSFTFTEGSEEEEIDVKPKSKIQRPERTKIRSGKRPVEEPADITLLFLPVLKPTIIIENAIQPFSFSPLSSPRSLPSSPKAQTVEIVPRISQYAQQKPVIALE